MSGEQKKDLIKNLRNLAITKQLNFLIGSGASLPAIPLMGMIEEENKEDRNKKLSEKVREVSKELINNELSVDTSITLRNYEKFIFTIIEILNLSNSRQAPKTINLFTTNYDLFIERASDTALKLYRFIFNDGASGYFDRKLESANYNRTVSYRGLNDNYTNEIPSLSLIKPHGSMNWKASDDSILIRNDVVDSACIVKPDGYEEKETFLSNHFHEMLRVFQLELDKPQSVLFIVGFSFQDPHIAKMVKRAIQNPELMVYAFGFQESDRKIYLDNLRFADERRNFKILTPKDFGDEFKTEHFNEDGVAWHSFTLKNFTNVLKGASLEDIKNDK